MSDCKVFRREIGEASGRGDLAGAVAAHADSCHACGETLREREAVRGLVRGLARVEAPADFEFRLRARMAAAEVKGRRGPFGGLRLVYKFAPVALATAFLIVSGALYLRQTPNGSRAGAPAGDAGEVASNATGAQTKAPAARVDSQNSTAAPGKAAPVEVADRTDGPKSHMAKATAPRPQHTARRSTEAARVTGGAGQVEALNTTVASVSSAAVIRGRTLSIPMETGAAPLRLLLRDERGAMRLVPVRSVSFGAQDVIARDGARRQTPAVDDEGVW
jgi:hypothetical protein